MGWKLTVGGVDKTALVHQATPVRVSFAQNERPTARFTCLPGYAPARLAEVLIYDTDGLTVLFGGIALRRQARGVVPGAAQVVTDVDCTGFATYFDWCFVSLTYASETTLGAVLADLVDKLPASYGVTLSGTYAETLAAFTWSNVRVSDALRELAERTGKVYTISPAKVLSLASPGSVSAPVSLTDATPNCREVRWADPDQPSANTVLVACGPTGQSVYAQQWTVVGAETAWVADLEAAGPGGYWVVTVDPPVGDTYYGTVGIGAMFSWDWATKTLTSHIGALAAGTTLAFPYVAQYPFIVTATAAVPATASNVYFPMRYYAPKYFAVGYFRGTNTAGTTEVQALFSSPTTLTFAAGQELATALLAQVNQAATEIEVDTLNRGAGTWAPGQALTVALTGRGLNGTFLVTQVDLQLTSDTIWEWSIRATSSSAYTGSDLDRWRALIGGGGSASAVVVTGVPASAPAAVPPLIIPMGGSTSEYHIGTSGGTWFDIANPIRPFVVGEYYQTRSPQVRCRIWGNDATTLNVRVYNLTTAAVAGTGSNGSATPTEIEIPVTLANGRNEYLVQVQPGDGKSGWVASAIFETVG